MFHYPKNINKAEHALRNERDLVNVTISQESINLEPDLINTFVYKFGSRMRTKDAVLARKIRRAAKKTTTFGRINYSAGLVINFAGYRLYRISVI